MAPSWRGILTCLLAATAAVACQRAHADGGRLRASEMVGPWQVAIFTSPAALSVGTVDVSIFVQQAESHKISEHLTIFVEARHTESGQIVRQRATHATATNKLFQAATCELRQAGSWRFCVEISAPGQQSQIVAFDADVAPSAAVWPGQAWWFAWPAAPVMLFLVHRRLLWLRRRESSTA